MMAVATSTLVNLVENKELVLNFLESIDFIREINLKCNSYARKSIDENSTLPLFFTLKIDYREIIKDKLKELITHRTEHFLSILNEVIQSLVNTFLSDYVPLQQIHCSFQLTGLPAQDFNFSLRSTHINVGLSTFSCIIASVQPIENYIRQSTWKCNQCFNAPLIILRKRIFFHKAPKCSRCLKECTELTQNRVTSTVCIAKVLETDSLKNRAHCSFVSAIEIRLFDDLCQELKIGHEYTVVGVFEIFDKFYNVFSISLV